ncbi:MAG: DUF4417 domain-containing protein [Dehalococcoidales bacterium]|nr:DUF4417 domain-containing protein [Dehalococcoidales bacterium]
MFKNYLFQHREKHAVSDSFKAFLVEDAHFTPNEEYPIIRSEMVSSTIPKRVLPFDKAIVSKEDLSQTFICTYSNDQSFERIRRDPAKYIPFFRRTAGIIGFDFSIHVDMPIIKQKSQINDNLSLTYYYGSKGIPVIPNLRCGVSELLPEFLLSIPENVLVAIGTHGFFKTLHAQCEWLCFLDEIIPKLRPPAVIVYGPLNRTIESRFQSMTEFVTFEPWIDGNIRERKNANKKC